MNTILFDLDGTLLSMDTDKFMQVYVKAITEAFSPHIDPEVFLQLLWAGTRKMLENPGDGQSNEAVFYRTFFRGMEEQKDQLIRVFQSFYQNEFDQAKSATALNEDMVEAVSVLKGKGYCLAVATNPLFPLQAVERRLHWAGLLPEDFKLITSFETMHACKPNPLFYQEVLGMLEIPPQEALMVGNDALEDLVAGELGISTYLVTDCLLQAGSYRYTPDYQGTSADFLNFAKAMPACGDPDGPNQLL